MRALTTTLPEGAQAQLVQAGAAPMAVTSQTVGGSSPSFVLTKILYVDQNAPAGGDGSIAAPFNAWADAAAAAPGPVLGVAQPCVLMLSPGDYSAEGVVAVTDKALTIIGAGLLNLSGTTFTHGIFIRVTSTGNVPLGTTLIGVNSQFQPNSDNLTVLLFRAYCEQNGDATHSANVVMNGPSPLMNRSVGNGAFPNIADLYAFGGSYGNGTIHGSMNMRNSEIEGSDGLILDNNAAGESVCLGTLVKSGPITTHHPLAFWNCTFSPDASSVVISTLVSGRVTTDLATYERGVRSGVTWPVDTAIIEQQILAPVRVNDGGGTNQNVDATAALGTNIAGDRFIAELTIVGIHAPAALAGWTQIGTAGVGQTQKFVFMRDTVSTGGEVGNVTWTIAAGNFTNQLTIHTFRYVKAGAVGAAVENVTTATSTSAVGSIAAPTVTPTGVGRTACCFSGSNGATGTLPTQITGATGASWVDRETFQSGLTGTSNVQTAALADSQAVTGGTMTMPVGGGTQEIARVAFALIGAAP